jgi:rare lipoprotein A
MMVFLKSRLAGRSEVKHLPRIIIFIMVCALSACSTTSRYSMKHDVGPKGSFDASDVPDAVPVWEPFSRQGNGSPYTVRGVTYHLADIRNGFEETGIASWYGLKFHGELTSNGERYNMYAMSAAHKHLPLPSYVRVTNLENGKTVIVRVNDRGPFHKGRVIDLSYAAATKLGYADKGTARVKVELIKLPMPGNALAQHAAADNFEDKIAHFIQVAAFSSRASAEAVSREIAAKAGTDKVFIASYENKSVSVHRVRLGPFADEHSAQRALRQLRLNGYQSAQIIQRALSASNI